MANYKYECMVQRAVIVKLLQNTNTAILINTNTAILQNTNTAILINFLSNF